VRTPLSDRYGLGLGRLLDKGGTSEGAARGWETRRGRAPAEPEKGDGRRKKKAEDKPKGRRKKAAEAKPKGRGKKAAEPAAGRQAAVKTDPEVMRQAVRDPSKIALMGYSEQQGSSTTYRVTFADGTSAAYKPRETTILGGQEQGLGLGRHTIDAEIPESAREIATYSLSREMGMDIVPHVEEVDYGQGPGHAMAWVDGREGGALPPLEWQQDLKADHPDIHRMAALDFVTGITDRHEHNFVKGEDGRYYLIDSGLAFPRDSEYGEFMSFPMISLEGRYMPDEVKQEVLSTSPETVREVMTEAGFREEDARGAQARLETLHALIRDFDGFWPDQGWVDDHFEKIYQAHQKAGA